MTDFRIESSLSRIELVVLACLSQSKTTPNDGELGEVVREFALPSETTETARRRAAEIFAMLVRRKLVTGDIYAAPSMAGGKTKPRKLTDEGKRVLRTAFQLPKVPTWVQVRDKHLPALALGKTPGSQSEQKISESEMITAVLSTRFSIQGARTPMDICDALIADALGMPRGALTLDAIRAHVLMRGIENKANTPRHEVKLTKSGKPSAASYASKVATWVAYSSIGASNAKPNKSKMAQVLGRRWVAEEPSGSGATSRDSTECKGAPPAQLHLINPPSTSAVRPGPINQPSQNPPKQTPPTNPVLLQAVQEAIPRVGADGRFGEKVYVSAIWHTIERDRKAGDLSLDNFKRWLLGANRDGWLVLARADLVGAMDPRQVSESEINDRGATFHFVLDQRSGATMSQRETYVR